MTSAQTLFNFELTPLEQVQPWGEPGQHNLHWFGLTDGQYWIQAGPARLFEYSEFAQTHGAPRYCNYQVVRLGLEREHSHRSHNDIRRRTMPTTTDWNLVRAAIAAVERNPTIQGS